MKSPLLKLAFIPGLSPVVTNELAKYPNLNIAEIDDFFAYVEAKTEKDAKEVLNLRSITNAYAVRQDPLYNPAYLSRHKSVLGELVEFVIRLGASRFVSFSIDCAGSDSDEVRSIRRYVKETFKLEHAEDADLKIHIGKVGETWEVGVELTKRPLSLRDYKVANMKGALNPTIAYAMNVLANVTNAQSYLNVCSGSGTLLIEAGLENPDLKLVGFDIDGKHNALAVENIKKAGLIKKISLKTADLANMPDLGTFDVIASDLPFGMLVSKDEDLESLYKNFVAYCEQFLNPNGTVVAYTSEHEILEEALSGSKFEIVEELELRLSTNNPRIYLHPKIFVCKFK